MRTFYLRTKNHKTYLLLIRDENKNIFGAYITDEIRNSQVFYESGETFIFTFYKSERIHYFNATGVNDLYIRTDEDSLSFGASNNKYSIFINGYFNSGYTDTTTTFKNPILTGCTQYKIMRMEMWAFTDELM